MAEAQHDSLKLQKAIKALFPDAELELQALSGGRRSPDFRVFVRAPNSALELLLEYKNAASYAQLRDTIRLLQDWLAKEPQRIPMLASDYLSPAMQDRLRECDVPFLDLAGNAWLRRAGLLIDRRGFANPSAETRLPRGPFSDKASLVPRSLLRSTSARGIRDLAGELELTPGYVSKVVKELERRGYISRSQDGVTLRHGGELLRDWVHSYRRREPVQRSSFFALAPSAPALLEAIAMRSSAFAHDWALTGHAGASQITRYAEFDTVDVYVRDAASIEAFAAALDARPAARGGNLILMVPYYRVSAFFAEQVVSRLNVVSDLQLYLDLYDYPVRGREQAELLYERRLAPRLKELENDGTR
jgi:hypothetical protein